MGRIIAGITQTAPARRGNVRLPHRAPAFDPGARQRITCDSLPSTTFRNGSKPVRVLIALAHCFATNLLKAGGDGFGGMTLDELTRCSSDRVSFHLIVEEP